MELHCSQTGWKRSVQRPSPVRFVGLELSCHPLPGQVSVDSEVIAKNNLIDNCLINCGGERFCPCQVGVVA